MKGREVVKVGKHLASREDNTNTVYGTIMEMNEDF
jgi:hypothetical protein